MTIRPVLAAISAIALTLPATIAFAGDPEEGERQWRQCRSCHMITSDDGETIQRGGRVGPDLYGIADAPAAAVEGFRYSNDLVAAAEEHDLVWTRENFIAYTADPTGFLREFTGNSSARSSMNFQMRSGAEDVWAYLESLSE
ncbi:MAG: cytochrome C [Pararhodobacter sp.]|nr:cytochrome C [Pararhodobacter sp.]